MLRKNAEGGKEAAVQKIRKRISYILLILAWIWAILTLISNNHINAIAALDAVSAAMLVVLVRLAGQIPFNFVSYLTLSAMIIAERFAFRAASYNFLFLYFLADICILLLIQTGTVKKYFTRLSVIALMSEAFLISYDYLSSKMISYYFHIGRALNLAPIEKGLLIALFSALFLGAFVLCGKIAGCFLRKKYDLFQLMTKRFSELEAHLFLLVTITLVFLKILGSVPLIAGYFSKYLQIFIILMDAAYIGLMFKAVSMKEKMTAAENYRNAVSAYSSDLETTIENMRQVRHDAKNLLFTMGSFVEEKGDDEIKEFYRNNIVPFIQDAVVKNELHDKLRIIRSDEMKSFFYFKITEMMRGGIRVNVEILSRLSVSGRYGDAIRLLGIFLDNAAEEAILTPEKSVSIKISSDEDEKSVRIRIGNSVRSEVRSRGVIPGTTEKGLGRGQGLIIADKILSRYDNMILNSYFTDTEFVQRLTVSYENLSNTRE